MQPSRRQKDEHRTEPAEVSGSNAAVAHALEERLASGRPMPRSLRRAYEQLMARDSDADERPANTDSER